jgi:hypothetical protein
MCGQANEETLMSAEVLAPDPTGSRRSGASNCLRARARANRGAATSRHRKRFAQKGGSLLRKAFLQKNFQAREKILIE